MGTHDSDEILATRILKEDSQVARTQLYYKHSRLAWAIASRFFRSPDLVDDVVNVSFMKAFTSLAIWNAQRERFPVWFHSIVKHTAIDLCRKRETDRERFRELSGVRCGYLQQDFFTDDPCEFHSERWFDAGVRAFIKGYLGRLGPERIRFLVDPPPGRIPSYIRARQLRDRRELAGQLEIVAAGRELSRRITNELLLATCCGKLPGGLIQ
jgi:RNA polymerase sigma factor (sigma-70 family)